MATSRVLIGAVSHEIRNLASAAVTAHQGLAAEQGIIVRLPKLFDDPAWEAMAVPETLTIEDFLAALRLWRWQRRMEGRPIGYTPRGGRCAGAAASEGAALRV